MLHNPFKIVKMFEEEVAHYAGSKYAVATTSCTDSIWLCCAYERVDVVTIPKRTYISVPQSIIHSGGQVKFEDLEWSGIYQLKPFPIYDAAKRLTSDMYIDGTHMCLSFHLKKPLPIGKGGMILTDSKDAYEWFLKARYEGRSFNNPNISYREDPIDLNGYNMYMTPEQAARGLWLMQHYPKHNDDQKEIPDYQDLTTYPLFKGSSNVIT